MGWHPIYEMENEKCLKPPISYEIMKQLTSKLSIKPGISPPSHLSVRGPLDALLGTGSRWVSKPQHSWGCHKIFKNSLKVEPQWLLAGVKSPKRIERINKNSTSKGFHLRTSFQPWWQPWPHISPPSPVQSLEKILGGLRKAWAFDCHSAV